MPTNAQHRNCEYFGDNNDINNKEETTNTSWSKKISLEQLHSYKSTILDVTIPIWVPNKSQHTYLFTNSIFFTFIRP
jgi:hypothetical protein